MFVIISACRNKVSQDHVDPISQEIVVEIPEDFPAFYQNFFSDSNFQMDHIMFPLAGESPNDSLNQKSNPPYFWEEDSWQLHQPIDPKDPNHIRTFDNMGGIITEIVREKNNAYWIERRYAKLAEEWFLIYYGFKTNIFK